MANAARGRTAPVLAALAPANFGFDQPEDCHAPIVCSATSYEAFGETSLQNIKTNFRH